MPDKPVSKTMVQLENVANELKELIYESAKLVDRRDALILKARQESVSLRAIAQVAGISHTMVDNIAKDGQRWNQQTQGEEE